MKGFPPSLSGLATAIGSLPHTDPEEARSLVLRLLPEIPAWPQLPKRSSAENMYVQFSQGFPGVVVEGDRVYVNRAGDLELPLEELYGAYLEERLDCYPIGPDHAAGLHAFLQKGAGHPRAIKGQVTGPVSLGLQVVDQERRPILYDDVLADALARFLRLRAAWQERELRRLCPHTIIFLDEPSMASFGSAFISLPREKAISLLEEVLGGLSGLKGVHCCGNTDWSLLLATSVDILSLDAYDYALALSLYPAELRAFLDRGGAIAWGIVPTQEEALARETAPSLRDRLVAALDLVAGKGIPGDLLVERSLITPACGLAPVSPGAAERALELTAGVSREFRRKYRIGG